MLTNQPNQQLNIDESNLSKFDTTRLQANDLSAHNKRGVIMGYPQQQQEPVVEEDEEAQQEQQDSVVEDVENSEQNEAPPEDNSPFTQQFEQTFGVKPKEAMELVNSLQAFRDEQLLMRTWGVDPIGYDDRMSQVREFYNSLPENGREQFNTVEGAAAIWNHLQEIGKAKETKPKQPTTHNTRVKRAIAKPKYDFKRSDITRMPKEEYQRQLPAIVKAFQTGRVLDD